MPQDFDQIETLEQKEGIMDEWVRRFSETGEIREIDSNLLRSVLEEYGAKFDNLDGKGYLSLSGYSNRSKSVGINQVWGARKSEYKAWCDEWAKNYEDTGNVMLANLTSRGIVSKTHGMRQFLGQLTSYAISRIEFDDLKEDFEKRYLNFKKPEKEREKLLIVGYNINKKTGEEVPFAPASFPPEFPVAAWAQIKSWKS